MFYSTTNADPFKEEPLPKAYYFPSLEKSLTTEQQKTCFSLAKMKDQENVKFPNRKDAKFLRGSNKLSSHEIPTREDGTVEHNSSSGSQFNESWPSTDKNVSGLSQPSPSSSSTPGDVASKHADSTLSKYVDRFRHGEPCSREHRQRARLSNAKDFWWISPPSCSSTPVETSSPEKKSTSSSTADTPPRQPRKLLNKKFGQKCLRDQPTRPLREIVEEDDLDNLRTRTDLLLEESENTCSDLSTPESLPKRPSSWMLEKHRRQEAHDSKESAPPRPQPAPEDDILYQWRLARRLERAQEDAKRDYAGRFSDPSTPLAFSGPARPLVRSKNLSTRDGGLEEREHEKREVDKGSAKLSEGQVTSRRHSRPDMEINSAGGMNRYKEPKVNKRYLERDEESGYAIASKTKESVGKEELHLRENERRDIPIETDVAGICFTQRLPPHVHMMCDILPCTSSLQEQQDGHLRKECTAIQYVTVPPSTRDNTSAVEQQNQMENNEEKRGTQKPVPIEVPSVPSPVRGTTRLLKPDIPHPATFATPESEKTIAHHPGLQKRQENEAKASDDENMLGNVIGQVISERLFASLSSSRRSSASEVFNEERAENGQLSKTRDDKEIQTDLTEHLTESGEPDTAPHGQQENGGSPEFMDDEIIIRLRQQAEFYKDHIRNIDRILEQMKD